MKNVVAGLALLTAVAAAPAVRPQGGSTPQEPLPTVGSVLNMHYGIIEQEVVSAAEAMSEDKYSSAPTNGEFKGVRTFAEEASSEVRAGILTSSVFSLGGLSVTWLAFLLRLAPSCLWNASTWFQAVATNGTNDALDAGPLPAGARSHRTSPTPKRASTDIILGGCEWL